PETWRARMVFADWSSAAPQQAHKALTQMLDPPARAIWGGDGTDAARLQDAQEFCQYDRRVLNVLDDLVRAEGVETLRGERQLLQRRLMKAEPRCAALRRRRAARRRRRPRVQPSPAPAAAAGPNRSRCRSRRRGGCQLPCSAIPAIRKNPSGST